MRGLERRPTSSRPPFDAFWWTPRIHLVCFVHRVAGLEPGLYTLARSADGLASLQRACRDDFAWIRPEGVGDDLPLFLLAATDARRLARQPSCAQDIASDGFFSLGMLVEFDSSLAQYGPGFYRHLFREAGAIGQVLSLEAEAAGCRGTGIGCFFDDAVHDVLGLRDEQLQSLYHFTVGIPVEDARLQTSSGYPWE